MKRTLLFLAPLFLFVIVLGSCGRGLCFDEACNTIVETPEETREIPEFFTNMDATRVFGQPDFVSNTSNNGGRDGDTLATPDGVHSDGTKLAIVDRANHRVLLYDNIETNTTSMADTVLGQPDFATGGTTGCSATQFNDPRSAGFNSTHLFVTDVDNNRVLVWNGWPSTDNTPADTVVGSTSMTVCPVGVLFNGWPAMGLFLTADQMLIADSSRNRVLFFDLPVSTGVAPTHVAGQPNLTTYTQNTTQAGMRLTMRVSADKGKMCVADHNNHRVLLYDELPTADGASADVVLGQANFTSGTANRGGTRGADTMNSPHDCVFGDGRLFVADGLNHRVLIWDEIPTMNGQPADRVIGQADFLAGSANKGATPTASSLNKPSHLGYTGKSLFVVDQLNNRVLEYK